MVQPPKYALSFLQWFCDPVIADEIEGDLFETFQEDIRDHGLSKARRKCWLRVFQFFKPRFMKKRLILNYPNNMSILKNYFIVAIRNLSNRLGYTSINVLGLAAGLACCVMILLFVNYEMSYENFQNNSKDIYRVALERVYPDRQVDYAISPVSLGPRFVEEFPEVEQMVRIGPPFGNVVLQYGDQYFNETNLMSADSTLFDVFTFEFVHGNPESALKGTNSMIMSESAAKKYFGNDNPMGKIIKNRLIGELLVTGVFKDYPENSHIKFDLVTPHLGVPFLQQESYTTFSVATYVKLTSGANPDDFEAKVPDLLKKYAEGEFQRNLGVSYDEYIAAGNGYKYFLQPLEDIHLHSHLQAELQQNGSYHLVLIFIFVAVFILVIACINFMNLSTARSTERAKEVGIRKVLGSVKGQLVGQFLVESVIVAFLSLIIALIIVRVALPYFNYAANVPLVMSMLLTPGYIMLIVGATLIIGLLAGTYPAFVLSAFKPVEVLKGQIATAGSGLNLRNGLVVFQFCISIILIAGTLVINSQMHFLLTKDMGFDTEQLLILDNAALVGAQSETFRQEIAKNSQVIDAGYVSAIPGTLYPGFLAKKQMGDKDADVARLMNADAYGLQTMNVELLEGRFFDERFNDSLSMVVNESTVKKLGYEDPIGKKIFGQIAGNQGFIGYTIIGVIKDYHFHTLHRKIEPQVIAYFSSSNPNSFVQYMPVRVKSENLNETIADLEAKWQKFVPDSPFKHYFIDDYLGRQYENEKRSGGVFYIFTVLAIILACAGLFSLSAYVAGRKKKEIGVRKVLGSSVWSIVLLLSKEFTLLMGIAIIIGLPVSYYWMDNWLNDFAYRIDVSIMTLLISGALALIIGWITVSFQSIKAAIVNPVDSLKNE